MFRLVIGDKRYSSWSLRPWLVLKMLEEPFEEVQVRLYQSDTRERILQYSPTGKVPLLVDHHLKIWDSLAICEYLAECYPAAGLWPREAEERALARAVSAEMHAGFSALRQQMGFDCGQRHVIDPDEAARADIERITQLWHSLRAAHREAGPFLFGRFGIADAMFAPIVFRFETYGVTLDGEAAAYAAQLRALPAMQAWHDAALAEAQAAAEA